MINYSVLRDSGYHRLTTVHLKKVCMCVCVCVCLHSCSCKDKFVQECGVARLWDVARFSFLLPCN